MKSKPMCQVRYLFFNIIFLDFIYFQRGEGREKEKERSISVWVLLECPPLRTWPATQACVLSGNRTGHPLVRRPAFHPLSHTSQGQVHYLNHMQNYHSLREALSDLSSIQFIVYHSHVLHVMQLGQLIASNLGNTSLHEHGQGHRPGFRMQPGYSDHFCLLASDKKAHF